MQFEWFWLFLQQHQNGKCAKCVGNAGGNCNTIDTHVKHDDKQQVESGVDESCHNQNVERTLGVALAAQNGGSKVVYHEKWRAAHVYAQIKHRVAEHVGRCVHQLQHWSGYEKSHNEHGEAA